VLSPLPLRSSSARETYTALRVAILAGKFKPDARLYETKIATELGVSRTPVREALAMLEAEELVVSVPNRGTLVRRVTAEEVRETYDVRVVVEGHAARLAAQHITERGLIRLRKLNAEMERVVNGSTSEELEIRKVTELNADFHCVVAAVAGNRVLERTVTGLINTPLYARAYYWFTNDRRLRSIQDHTDVIALLAARDEDGCERFWRDHLARGRDQLITHLEASKKVPA
jgi:DNA-binding GntR family transcriptional regulator